MKKALTSIIATAALLALVVPAANATFDRSLPSKTSHAKVVKVSKTKVTKVTKVGWAKGRTLIIVSAPTQAPTVADDCVYSGNNCTDQQLCITWGMNCDIVTSSPTESQVAPEQPVSVETSIGDAASALAETVAAPSNDPSPAASIVDDLYEDC